jgi:hypothetical protein
MKNDLYLKGVLTVIASCLLYLCWAAPTNVVHGQPNSIQRVSIVGVEQNNPVPVQIMNQPIRVNSAGK